MEDRLREREGEILSEVNGVLPLAICPGIPETHFNLRQIMEKLKLHEAPNLKVVMDLCLLNTMIRFHFMAANMHAHFFMGPVPSSLVNSANLAPLPRNIMHMWILEPTQLR